MYVAILTVHHNKTKQTFVGDVVGLSVGELVGLSVGDAVGLEVGDPLGDPLGDAVGEALGNAVGNAVGLCVGDADVGMRVEGDSEGACDGANVVGLALGSEVNG